MAQWCELGANITPEKCRVYRTSGSSSCRGCKGVREAGDAREPEVPETEGEVVVSKYTRVEAGCKLARVKNKRCTGHNREYEAALQRLEQEVGKLKKEDIPEFLPPKAKAEAPQPFRVKHPTTPIQKPKEPQMKAEILKGGALGRLLKKQTPLPSTSIVLNFAQDEYAAIQDEKVTAEEIRDLVLLLIAGELLHRYDPASPAS